MTANERDLTIEFAKNLLADLPEARQAMDAAGLFERESPEGKEDALIATLFAKAVGLGPAIAEGLTEVVARYRLRLVVLAEGGMDSDTRERVALIGALVGAYMAGAEMKTPGEA